METFTVLDLVALETLQPDSLYLRCYCGRKGLGRTVFSTEINRPGLALTGFMNRFVGERIQIIGHSEYEYIMQTPQEALVPHLEQIMAQPVPCMIFCYNLEPPEPFREVAERHEVPLLVTSLDTSVLSIRLQRVLDGIFAPERTIHGVFVEVEGMGVLIEGESGVGKSETALELLDRGHRIIADDFVKVKCLNGNTLWGYSHPDESKKTIEIRGLGSIDISQVYGMNSIRDSKPLEIVVHLEPWNRRKLYERMGTPDRTESILDVMVPVITIPVKPGRNIPILIEAAVLNQRMKPAALAPSRDYSQPIWGGNGASGTSSQPKPAHWSGFLWGGAGSSGSRGGAGRSRRASAGKTGSRAEGHGRLTRRKKS